VLQAPAPARASTIVVVPQKAAACIPLAATLQEVVVTIDAAMAAMHQDVSIVVVEKELGAEGEVVGPCLFQGVLIQDRSSKERIVLL
jgi:hypothetical protein